jgi:hypothetical protein
MKSVLFNNNKELILLEFRGQLEFSASFEELISSKDFTLKINQNQV